MRYLLLSLILLTGCDMFQTPVRPEYRRDTVQVTWMEVDTEAKLYHLCGVPEQHHQTLACAVISQTGPCTIYTYRNPPMEVMGHEMAHCFLGKWHG